MAVASMKPTSLALRDVAPGQVIRVTTQYSVYTLEVINPAKGLVFAQGGTHLPEPELCRVRGSYAGVLMRYPQQIVMQERLALDLLERRDDPRHDQLITSFIASWEVV